MESEVLTHKKQQQQVEEQIERHQAYDRNLSVGMKVAALSLGGVVIGALTAGVGLVPYITVVGLAAVAGGGAVALQFRKPSDSRLILAAESMQEAMDWKSAIERQIARLEENRKPMLPPSANAQGDRDYLHDISCEHSLIVLNNTLPLMTHSDTVNSNKHSTNLLDYCRPIPPYPRHHSD